MYICIQLTGRSYKIQNRKEILNAGEKVKNTWHQPLKGLGNPALQEEAVCEVATAAGMAYFKIFILKAPTAGASCRHYVDRCVRVLNLRGNSSGRKFDFYLDRGGYQQQYTARGVQEQ